MGAKPSIPKLPARGYYKNGDGFKTLTNADGEIAKAQKLMNWYMQNRNIKPLDPDGHYGDKSVAMTKAVQKLFGLPVNGCFGNSCLQKLKAATSPAPAPKTTTVKTSVSKTTTPKATALAVQDKNPEKVDYQKKSIEAAKEIFPLSYKYKCKHGEGGYTKELIKKNKRINCSGSCSAVMRQIGVLSSGRLFHRGAVGSNAVKKKNTFSKAVGGNINGIKNAKKVKIGKSWKYIPSQYKVAGAFYVQDSNFFMYMGKNSSGKDIFFNCNQSHKTYTSASMYTKTSGYVTSHPVLCASIPNKA